ncbi:hypothetical protein F8A87_07460 [Betaproteobacteria bacterium SCN2]|jgi:hypothetical protein|nr:hypothetical protein F8A87_07460 [Betaproteobacteria bacterium SCN2]
MEQQKQGKLNQLQRLLPEGLVVDAAWLERHSYSGALRKRYVSAGWLEQVTRGVYRRPPGELDILGGATEKVQWQTIVISLQTLLQRPVAVGGRTALEFQGFAHYLSSGGFHEIHLYGDAPLPRWVFKLPLDSRFLYHNANRLFKSRAIGQSNSDLEWLPSNRENANLEERGLRREFWGHWKWPLTLSTPERAILELLDEVPQNETFHQADVLMEGLRTLSPKRLQSLLTDCRSVKVKRLFFWFAERHKHTWLNRLDPTSIDFGKGKRVLVRGGKLDRKYLITVPENLDAGG